MSQVSQFSSFEIQNVIQHGINMPYHAEEVQKLWAELLDFYMGVLIQKKAVEKIRPGLEKLHNYFHETFETQLFESELQLRFIWRKQSSFRSADRYRIVSQSRR